MPENFTKDLTATSRKKMIDLLNQNLANSIALGLAVKQAHWNVKGPGYIGVHLLLDEVAARLNEASDQIAERAVILGGFAEGTLEITAKAATLEAYPVKESKIDLHIEALKQRFLFVGAAFRSAIDTASEAGDQDTADIFTQLSRSMDKDAWFIGANA